MVLVDSFERIGEGVGEGMVSSPIEGLESVDHGIEGKEKPAMGSGGLKGVHKEPG